jgi:hypothetical protein
MNGVALDFHPGGQPANRVGDPRSLVVAPRRSAVEHVTTVECFIWDQPTSGHSIHGSFADAQPSAAANWSRFRPKITSAPELHDLTEQSK